MQNPDPELLNTRSRASATVWREGVLPTLAALVVTAVQFVERAQVDWAADCTAPGVCSEQVASAFPLLMAGWLPAIFVFAVAHAALRHHPAAIDVSRGERALRVLLYIAVAFFPYFGWYLLYAGFAFGFLAAITIIGLPIMIPAGVVGAGWVGGLALGLAAGPSFKSTPWTEWRRLLFRYANSTAMAAFVLMAGCVLFDPQFSAAGTEQPWLSALGILGATALACSIVWMSAMTRRWLVVELMATPAMRHSITIVAGAIPVLAIVAHVAISNGAIAFARKGSFAEPVASFIRGYRPPGTAPLALGGLDYIGPRKLITERSTAGRQRMVHERRDVGTPKEANHGWTVTDSYPEWQLLPLFHSATSSKQSVYVIADDGGVQQNLYCRTSSPGNELCLVDRFGWGKPYVDTEVQRTVAFEREDGYVFDAAVPGASLAIRYGARKLATETATQQDGTSLHDGTSPHDWPRSYCRLNLVGVTSAKFSVHQIVNCDKPWQAQAKQLREYVESKFASK